VSLRLQPRDFPSDLVMASGEAFPLRGVGGNLRRRHPSVRRRRHCGQL